MISCEAPLSQQHHRSDYHHAGSAFSYKHSSTTNPLASVAADAYSRHSSATTGWLEKNSTLSAALDSALHYHKKHSQENMNSMGMGPGGYNYVPQLSHASTAGFGSQYGAAELSHAYDTTRHTANSWYSPSAATDPTSRFNEYACKYFTNPSNFHFFLTSSGLPLILLSFIFFHPTHTCLVIAQKKNVDILCGKQILKIVDILLKNLSFWFELLWVK